jgi:hypothetical protein
MADLDRRALDELHDDRARAIALLGPVNLRNERMVEGGEHSRFALETRQPIRVVDHRLGQDLDGDITIELGIARPIDFSQPPDAERALNLVRTEANAGAQQHDELLRL